MISVQLSRRIAQAINHADLDLAMRGRIMVFARQSSARALEDLPGWLRVFLTDAESGMVAQSLNPARLKLTIRQPRRSV